MRLQTARQHPNDSTRAMARSAEARSNEALLVGAGLAGLLMVFAMVFLAHPAAAGPAAIAAPQASVMSPAAGLEALLAVPEDRSPRTQAEIADETIAAAVARGPAPETERAGGFRKRNQDLFRTERPLEIGEQDMLLRLRLRAKARETMSLELRF